MKFETYMLFTENMEAARKEISSVRGEVITELSGSVLIANLPLWVDTEALQYATEERPKGLDLVSDLMVEVWGRKKPGEIKRMLSIKCAGQVPEVTELRNFDKFR